MHSFINYIYHVNFLLRWMSHFSVVRRDIVGRYCLEESAINLSEFDHNWTRCCCNVLTIDHDDKKPYKHQQLKNNAWQKKSLGQSTN